MTHRPQHSPQGYFNPNKGTNMKDKKAVKSAKKAAPKKGGKPAAKPAAKTPAKKAAKPSDKYKKSGAASVATIAKQAVKAAKKPKNAPKGSVARGGKASAVVAKSKSAPKVVTGHKAGTLPGDETRNGVLRPREGTQARTLWDVCDKLQGKLGRPPARFEFRQAIFGKEYNPDSASFQYFAWRKFHGVKGRSIGIYPKRNSFEANTPAVPAKKAAKKAAKVPAAPAAKKAPAKAAKPATKPAASKKPVPAKKSATVSIDTPAVPEAPKVSQRAAKAAEAAKPSGGVTVTPPNPNAAEA